MTNNLSMNPSPHALIGVFWDIENCSIPRGKSPLAAVQKIRERLFKGHREAEFMCVCDVNKEHRDVIQELNDAQVTVVHINATSKNAADDKLRQSLRRFGNTHHPPATVVLISGDVNFAAELSDLRHRHNLSIILLHKHHVQDALIACAHEHYSFDELLGELPDRNVVKKHRCELLVSNLPEREIGLIRARLKMLSDNCGGRVLSVHGPTAIIRFPNLDAAERAKKRMDGETVFENQINVTFSDSPDVKPKVMKVKPGIKCQSPKRGTSRPNTSSPAARVCPKVEMKPSPSSSPQGHSSPKPEHMSRGGCHYPYGKKNGNGDKPHAAIVKDERPSSAGAAKEPTQFRRRLSSGGNGGRRLIDDSPQLKVLPKKHSDGSRYGPIVGHSGHMPSFHLFKNAGGSGSPANTQQIQTVVDRFSKVHKSSREVLLLQQQLFQEEQEKHVRGNDSNDSVECASVCSCPPFRESPGFQEFAPFRSHSAGPDHHQQRRWGAYHPRHHPDLNRTYAGESYFRPIESFPPSFGSAGSCSAPNVFGVDLIVSNLDYNISGREWKKIIQTTFQQQVQILAVNVQPQPDNTSIAVVTVPSIDEARFAISQFHRKKIGYKRIHVALKPTDQRSTIVNTKYEVVALLRSVPANSLPLFKFIELFEKRYHRNITVSELYKMRDIVDIHEQGGSGRTVSLTTVGKSSLAPTTETGNEPIEFLESPVCGIHCPEGSENYMVSMEMTLLPNVVIPLRHLAAQVHTLLLNHDGCMPLMSFPSCYAVEFPPLQEMTEGSVSLEHLLSCIPGVTIELSHGGVKKIKLSEKKCSPLDIRNCPSPVMSYHLSQFSREIVDMLRHCPSAILTFNKFIPFYHHHFGRQCRVADYGYTRLSELFDALPHVIQVLGCGNQKLLTLTHRIQGKRFQTDLLRVLKAQPTKQIAVSALSQAFEKVNGKPLYMPDYGVCFLDDLMHEISDTILTVSSLDSDVIIGLPRHDQTPEEIERTRTFAAEVIELLKHSRQCRMPFNKFVPAYHHHFGRQCKVSDYGFTKLIELFESIPDIIQIIEELDDKVICLTDAELLKVFAEQTTTLLKQHNAIPLQYFLQEFMRFHGYCIKLQDFNATSVEALLKKINYVVKVECVHGRQMVTLVDRSAVQRLAYRVVDILINQPGGDMRIPEFKSKFVQLYREACSMEEVSAEMLEVVEIHGNILTGTIKLSPLQMFARSIRSLLQANQNKLSLQNFEDVYKKHFGMELNSFHYGYPTVTSLLQAISHMVIIRGRGTRRTILLCQDFLNRLSVQVAYKNLPTRILCGPISDNSRNSNPPSNDSETFDEETDSSDDKELLQIASTHRHFRASDLLSDRVPSCVPSPELEPAVIDSDLIQLSSSHPNYDILSSLSLEEKKAQRTPLCKTPTSEMLQFAAQLLPPVPPSGLQESPDHQAFKDKIQELHNMLNSSPEELSPTKLSKKCRIAAKFNVPIKPTRDG